MARVPIGYMTWNTRTNMPYVGTRRRKVWTTAPQCEGRSSRIDSGELIVVPVYAEVPDEATV
jgi:hypothetical protein